MRVVVAMSGGVDSSTTAALLKEQGHEVIGLAMKTHAVEACSSNGCRTPEDFRDARRVADRLNIPFYVLDYRELFREQIVLPFARAYLDGLTPNPCVECNERMKFRLLLARARLLGADRLATGHYARIEHGPGGPRLLRGIDRRKDQSYFLYRLAPEQLEQILFPLGELTKDEVREHARRLDLPVADKQESQEICFVGPRGYVDTVERVLGRGARAGEIITRAGEVLGRHRGVHRFTLGQRRGLGIAAPQPLYVTGIDAGRARVTVGPREELLVREALVEQARWRDAPPDPEEVLEVQLRYRERPRPVHVEQASGGRLRLRFLEPMPRGAPGQAAVVYRGAAVLGGGTLCREAEPGSGDVLEVA